MLATNAGSSCPHTHTCSTHSQRPHAHTHARARAHTHTHIHTYTHTHTHAHTRTHTPPPPPPPQGAPVVATPACHAVAAESVGFHCRLERPQARCLPLPLRRCGRHREVRLSLRGCCRLAWRHQPAALPALPVPPPRCSRRPHPPPGSRPCAPRRVSWMSSPAWAVRGVPSWAQARAASLCAVHPPWLAWLPWRAAAGERLHLPRPSQSPWRSALGQACGSEWGVVGMPRGNSGCVRVRRSAAP